MESITEVFIISVLIIIHELGHVLIATLEKVKVDRIMIYPLGGITKLHMKLNISPQKEFIILLAGPIFQWFAFFLLMILLPNKKELIIFYHENILLFNLLPIYPLDGGKILKILLDNIFPLQKSMKWTIRISYLTAFFFCSITNNQKLSSIVMLLFLLLLIRKEDKKKKIMYEKFLLERYLEDWNFKKSVIIGNGNEFYRNRRHLIRERDYYYLEKEYLEKKYQKILKNH